MKLEIGNIKMLAEYHASPDDRVVSLPLETNSTIFKRSYLFVGQENHQNNKPEFRNLQTIMKHINNIIYSENRKEMLSDRETEFEHIVQSTDINVLQDYLHSVYNNNFGFWCAENERSTFLFFLIVYHVLVASENENSTHMLNVIKVKLLQLQECDLDFNLDCIFQLYLDVYYKDNSNDLFTNIHSIWKCDKATELNLKLAYCKNLNEAKDYKTLIQLIHHHADNLIESFEKKEHEQYNPPTAIMVLLHLLHYQVSLNKMERVKTITTILSRPSIRIGLYDEHDLLDGFYDCLLTLDNKQLLCTPYVIKLLQSLIKEEPFDYLLIILLSSDRLRQANHYTECIEFIKSNFQFISSFPTEMLKIQGECYHRQQYCITLLLLLNEYVTCYDTHKINLMLTKLLDVRVSFLSDIQSTSCYCFMGNKQCMAVGNNSQYLTSMMHEPQKKSRGMLDFKQHLLDIWDRTHCIIPTRSSQLRDFLLHMDPNCDYAIQGEMEQASYLKCIIEMMEINEYKNESVVSFIEFIKRSADYNVESLYNIIKMLCTFELQPEIEDMILQVVTENLMISCNKQYGFLSKLFLDINMISTKCQFLHKLTSDIAKTLLKFDDDTVKDFNNLIYKCYCTVRHDCRDEKDKNITKYKVHFTFIASMEAEEEMKKLTSLTNLLLLLTLHLITSGGHHKSAELKKYLSLKYEYRDTILYLLWCSGDVEINPGPTFRTLRKIPDSVKERNWIYEMCSILVRLLKYRSLDLKNGGLWKEKPLNWPPEWPFYDPRNKPKDQGYNTGTDNKLLKCLEEHCHSEGLFNSTSKFDDEQTQFKVEQYQKEIIAWTNKRTELFELYTLRQELDTLRAAIKYLNKYKNDPELHKVISDLNVDFIFDADDNSAISSEGYTDTVRDIAITFCRIGKGLNLLAKSDGIWKTPPSGWNLSHPYYSPCNDKKGRDKGQDDKLVDNLLTYCESNNITIPSELQPLIKAWKQRKTSEITKYYTIWSKTAIINHSLKYLELEDMLEQIHILKSLRQIGILLDTQQWRCPSVNTSCARDNDDKHQDLHSSPSSDIETNSTAKVASIQINSDNPSTPLPDSTQTKSKATPASPHSLVNHTDSHLCNIVSEQQNQWNQSSKHTFVNSFKDSCPIQTCSKAQAEADGNHQPISSVNSSNANEQLIPCIVHINDAISKPEREYNKISKTAKKRHRRNNDESCSEPKHLHLSEEDLPLLLQVLTSSLENGKDMAKTSPKANSNDCTIRTIIPDHLSHDLISIKSRPNLPASGKQTDHLVINKLPDTADDKPVDSSSSIQADNVQNKMETTSDQCVNQIVNLLEEIEQEYSSTVVGPSIPNTSFTTDQPSDLRNELPEYVELCINTYQNSYKPNDTLKMDIEKFIQDQDIDLS